MLLAISTVALSMPKASEPTRKDRRTIKIGDTLQKAYVSLDGSQRLVWLDITKIDNDTDLEQAMRICRFGINAHFVRVVGVRGGKRYSVCGYNIGKPA